MKLSQASSFYFCASIASTFVGVAKAYTDSAVFRQTFEDPDTADWDFDNLIQVQDYNSGGSQYGSILKTSYPPAEKGSPRITQNFDLDEQVSSATLSFDLKLHSQFEFVKGGKMHGLGGGTRTTGCDPIDPDGWSVRLTWKDEGAPQVYVYHQDRANRCGDGFRADSFKFQRGEWYRVDLQVKMNSGPDEFDGATYLYINGQQVVEKTGLRLSGNANVEIDKFAFSTFYGGSDSTWSPSKTTHIYWDNFVVNEGLRVTGEQATECEIFLGGIFSPSKDACCNNICGSCGGSGCGNLPGGGSQCCTGTITKNDVSCDSVSGAPCIFI